jgi:hypothetical protein
MSLPGHQPLSRAAVQLMSQQTLQHRYGFHRTEVLGRAADAGRPITPVTGVAPARSYG